MCVLVVTAIEEEQPDSWTVADRNRNREVLDRIEQLRAPVQGKDYSELPKVFDIGDLQALTA